MKKKKVLIADDNVDILEAMQLMLEDAEFEVTITEDGNVVQDMQDDLPDALILDIWMSGINGTDICQHLKSQERTRHIPIIVCSANKDTQKLAKACGADDFLAKPFEMMDLINKVKKHTG